MLVLLMWQGYASLVCRLLDIYIVPVVYEAVRFSTLKCIGLNRFYINIFYSEDKDWLRATMWQCPLLPFNALTLGDDEVSMLTHTYPHKQLRKIKRTICNHQADSPLLYVWPDVWSCSVFLFVKWMSLFVLHCSSEERGYVAPYRMLFLLWARNKDIHFRELITVSKGYDPGECKLVNCRLFNESI